MGDTFIRINMFILLVIFCILDIINDGLFIFNGDFKSVYFNVDFGVIFYIDFVW